MFGKKEQQISAIAKKRNIPPFQLHFIFSFMAILLKIVVHFQKETVCISSRQTYRLPKLPKIVSKKIGSFQGNSINLKKKPEFCLQLAHLKN